MVWLCFAVFFTIALFGRFIKGKWNNLLTVFAGFYSLSIALANLRLWSMKTPSTQTCVILVIGILSFQFGYITVISHYQRLYKISNSRIMIRFKQPFRYKYDLKKNVIITILFIVVLYTLYSFVRSMMLIRAGMSYAQIRSIYFNGNEAGGGRNRFDVYVYLPLLQSLVFLSCIAIFSEMSCLSRKTRSRLLLLTIICEILSMFTNGGRENIVYMFLTVVFAYSVSNIDKRIIKGKINLVWKKRKRLFVLLLGLVIVLLVIMTFRRSRTGETTLAYLLRTTYFYLSGWLVNFSERLAMLDDDSYTHGFTFLLGLIRLPAAIIHRMGVPDSHAYSIAEGITSSLQTRVDLGGSHTFNAYVSPFYYFYRDFGYVSVVFESFLFGLFCSLREKKYEYDKNLKNYFWYLFAFFLIISSMVRWEMVHIKTAMIVYYSFLFFRKEKC